MAKIIVKKRIRKKKNGNAKGKATRKKGWPPLNKFDFTRTEYEYFLSECPFTDEEKQVFDLRRKGKSITSISFELNMSESTVSRRIKSITNKVKKVI